MASAGKRVVPGPASTGHGPGHPLQRRLARLHARRNQPESKLRVCANRLARDVHLKARRLTEFASFEFATRLRQVELYLVALGDREQHSLGGEGDLARLAKFARVWVAESQYLSKKKKQRDWHRADHPQLRFLRRQAV